ncbi:MAG: endonuclease/exonuclease/phosphatase family protein [Planctomycetes bacterium]|nr:endonuclease/exonuclease/phosphatase family protein [Planctomycetota bacterium]
MLALRRNLASYVPPRTAEATLLLATWNLRDFGSNKFGHGNRLPESMYYIAEIISAFDLVAVQEVNEDMTSWERIMELLGPSWRYIATDVTEGASGNGERMVFVYDSDKVQFKHIAGEIVLPKSKKNAIDQFARTPFLVRFQSGWFKFNLCTVHLYYGAATGAGKRRRVEEIKAIGSFLKKRAKKDNQNYILLGDMNVVDPDDETMKALLSSGFVLPKDLMMGTDEMKWATNMTESKHYDQIAFMVRKDELEPGPSENNAGVFNYYNTLFLEDSAEDYYTISKKEGKWPKTISARKNYFQKEWRTWQMSDHLPLFVELKIDFTEKYLHRIREGTQPVQPPTPDATDS